MGKKFSIALAGVVCTGAVLAGCRVNTSVIEPRRDPVVAYPNVTLSQPSLARALAVNQPVVTETEVGLMRVSVPVRSRSREELYVEYRTVWLNEAGQPVGGPFTWRTVRISARQRAWLSARATTEEATNFNMQLRWSRP